MTSVPRSVSFFLEGMPPNANALHRGHFMANSAHRKVWHAASRYAAIDARNRAGIGKPFHSASLHISFQFPDRIRRDLDNLAAGAKGVIDGLTGVLVVDDDMAHLRPLTFDGALGAERFGMVVTVTEVPA